MNKTSVITIGMASDHAGYNYKDKLKVFLEKNGYEVDDFGCDSLESCDYPDYAHPLAMAVVKQQCQIGISLCGSGNGIDMVVNKYKGIRAALCWNEKVAELARSHNDANICALPARFIEYKTAEEIVSVFLNTDFDGGRHLRRIGKIEQAKML